MKSISEMEDILQLIPVYEKLADKKTGLCQYDLFIKNLGFDADQNASILFNLFDQVFINLFIKIYSQLTNFQLLFLQ